MRIVLQKDNIVEVFSSGHSSFCGLCPSISTLQYTFWYSVRSFCDAVCDLSVADGTFHYTFSKIAVEGDSLYKNLCSFFLMGIQVLQKEFSVRAKGELFVSIIRK